jgi:Regulator of Chromosome Condensation (RCC1) repeat protein
LCPGSRLSPVLVSALSGIECCRVASGTQHSLAMTTSGSVYAYGSGYGVGGNATVCVQLWDNVYFFCLWHLAVQEMSTSLWMFCDLVAMSVVVVMTVEYCYRVVCGPMINDLYVKTILH